MESLMKWVVLSAIAVLLATATVLVFGMPTMILWNYLMPSLFGLKAITFLEAICLNGLCSILFKSSSSSSSNKD